MGMQSEKRSSTEGMDSADQGLGPAAPGVGGRQGMSHPDVVDEAITSSTERRDPANGQPGPPSRARVLDAIKRLERAAKKLIDDAEGVTTMRLFSEFRDVYNEDGSGLDAEIFDDWLRRVCRDAAMRAGRNRSTQLRIPGNDAVDAYVTVFDGAGRYRRKALRFASLHDLDADKAIHEENVSAATRALYDVQRRNERLRPIMEAHGFATAGEAIDWLNA